MSDPDNVARLIAADSALATAANMLVAWATYRRKRARLTVKASETAFFTTDGPGRTFRSRPSFHLLLANQGEAAVKVDWAYFSARTASRWGVPRWAMRGTTSVSDRLRFPSPIGLEPVDGEPKFTAFPFELAGFDEELVHLVLPHCLGHWDELPRRMKYRVILIISSGRHVRTSWQRLRFAELPCTCPSCRSDHQQLSFEDALGA
ncbi:hypothetical protein ACIQ6Y_32880 [Streptomyces sp. NPDC096205]|uniref:hypothetical protein n=1 Tax=Streptomyces sp. NPDC096205 TaxID=3366081 RepID=UPI003816D469